MILVEDPIITDLIGVMFERRAKGLNDGSQDPERDARAEAIAEEKGIPEFYRQAVEDGKIEILPHQ